ncbi:YchJ family protein [Mycolicibacterium sp. HK-90]|uniref:YchJ family protein n=1 Tax=Mycolicibacterium sp. HK-90 TaxID=3056937 RepID=UPI0026599DD1|nr:YchJ family protein [Mycolicibacterium sp. HK-90]WKG05249.1 YchJ family protein [Mycolicibacterium sp. HK-90]
MSSDEHCPCGTGLAYADCCGPLHAGGRPAPTAVALMRSRFSAFALGDVAYLLTSWHPRTRPSDLTLDATIAWRRLQIVDTDAGGEDDATGVVEFRAQYAHGGKRHILHERSRFERVKGRWRYLDGDVYE